jgi:triosephosphate isomerase
MSRRKLIAANWKMYKMIAEAETFASGLRSSSSGLPHCDLVLFPPFLAIPTVAQILNGYPVQVGAQDLYWEDEGAYTGEVSGRMIIDVGGTFVLVGHSERRHVLGEGEDVVSRKLSAALRIGLVPVLCIGETLTQREAGQAEAIVEQQLESAIAGLDPSDAARVVFAYEPVWAIGTGKTATPEDAVSMHRCVRRCVGDRFGGDIAVRSRILYGGSVKPKNAAGLLGCEEIDGALIGGASLALDSFVEIARQARAA